MTARAEKPVERPRTACYDKSSDLYKRINTSDGWRRTLIRNNVEVDIKVRCIEEGSTQAEVAERIHTSSQYGNRIVKRHEGVVNHTFVRMMEALGYDVELTYVRRDGAEAERHREQGSARTVRESAR